jgi:F-type H+-transporting ATPase subunit delta
MPTNRSENSERFDVGAQQVAAMYAKSLLAAAEKEGSVDLIVAALDWLVDDVLARYPKFADIFGSALISHEEKIGVIDRTLGKQAPKLLLNFLKVLSGHGRLDLVRAVRQAMRTAYDELKGLVAVEVRSATPIDDQLAQYITNRVKTMIGSEPRLTVLQDAELIGGLVVRIGDKVYDGSARTELARARHDMISRSIHEIQSRRDRFRHSGGD